MSDSDTLTPSRKKSIFEEVIEKQKNIFEQMKSYWQTDRPDIYWKERMKLEAYEQYFKKLSEE